MLLSHRRSISLSASVVIVVLAGFALYHINEWWPGCNFARAWAHDEPLMIAAAKGGCTGCVRTLLGRGADPNEGDNIHGIPLGAAVVNGHYWTARLLLKKGALVNSGTAWGTPLCHALMSENLDNGITELLLDSGAALQWVGDATHPDFTVFDCLHHSDAGPQPSEEARRFGHLIDHGLGDLFPRLPEHRQAELLSFLYDDEIKQLAKRGAKLNLDVQDNQGKTIISLLPGTCGRISLLITVGAQYVPSDKEAISRCTGVVPHAE